MELELKNLRNNYNQILISKKSPSKNKKVDKDKKLVSLKNLNLNLRDQISKYDNDIA